MTTKKWSELDRQEQMSIVCEKFLSGKKYSEIAQIINQERNAKLTREAIYPIIQRAIDDGLIKYVPPIESDLTVQLLDKYDWLSKCKVVHTANFSDIAYHGAQTLIALLENMRKHDKQEVHVGFAGGHAMRNLVNIFSELIKRSDSSIPSRLVLHALVAGFDTFDPTTDPNTFFTLFHSSNPSGLQIKFVGLHAPPIVETDEYDKLKSLPGIKEAYDESNKIDIIVTSATNWGDEHSTFRKYMEKSPSCSKTLEEQKCIGDILWQPLAEKEPITTRTERRSMTLFELDQIAKLRQNGKYILLVLGPCAYCGSTKSEILSAILNQKEELITHLVADSHSVREVLET